MGLARTALFVRRTVGGLFSVEDTTLGTGNRVYVCSLTGVDAGGYGVSPDKPVATLDYAVGLCTAGKGDIIFLMPGHAESKAAAGNMALIDVIGVRIIGLGNGSLKPTFTLGHADATISVSAANVRIENVKIISDVADCAVGLTAAATADGLTVENCDFYDGAVDKELVIGISIAAACHEVTVRNCRFVVNDGDAGGCASAIACAGACNYLRFVGNFIQGNFTAGVIVASAAASVAVLIADNVIFNTDTGAGLGIVLKSDTTGAVVRNLVTNAKDTVAPVTAAACHVSQNYGSNAAGASGILKPAQDS
jgi:hypothetical protein